MPTASPNIVTRPLLPGDKGVEQTVYHMSRLARRDVDNNIVKFYVKKFKQRDDIDTVYAVYNHVYKSFKYVEDPEGIEYVSAPVWVIAETVPYRDCDDLTTFLCCLLMALGFKVCIKTISWDYDRCDGNFCPFTHVYLMVLLEDKYWVPLDPVKKKDGFGKEHAPIIRMKNWKVN